MRHTSCFDWEWLKEIGVSSSVCVSEQLSRQKITDRPVIVHSPQCTLQTRVWPQFCKVHGCSSHEVAANTQAPCFQSPIIRVYICALQTLKFASAAAISFLPSAPDGSGGRGSDSRFERQGGAFPKWLSRMEASHLSARCYKHVSMNWLNLTCNTNATNSKQAGQAALFQVFQPQKAV